MRSRRAFLGTGVMAAAGTAVASPPKKSREAHELSVVSSSSAPKAIGPYSQAIKTAGTVYVSGQIAIDPATGNLVEGDFPTQARRVFENLKAVLHGAGTDLSRVVKATVYLTDLGNFQTLNAIYAEVFGDHKPARSTVGVAALPRGAAVEIDLIAVM